MALVLLQQACAFRIALPVSEDELAPLRAAESRAERSHVESHAERSLAERSLSPVPSWREEEEALFPCWDFEDLEELPSFLTTSAPTLECRFGARFTDLRESSITFFAAGFYATHAFGPLTATCSADTVTFSLHCGLHPQQLLQPPVHCVVALQHPQIFATVAQAYHHLRQWFKESPQRKKLDAYAISRFGPSSLDAEEGYTGPQWAWPSSTVFILAEAMWSGYLNAIDVGQPAVPLPVAAVPLPGI